MLYDGIVGAECRTLYKLSYAFIVPNVNISF